MGHYKDNEGHTQPYLEDIEQALYKTELKDIPAVLAMLAARVRQLSKEGDQTSTDKLRAT